MAVLQDVDFEYKGEHYRITEHNGYSFETLQNYPSFVVTQKRPEKTIIFLNGRKDEVLSAAIRRGAITDV